jgi:hypothetical protein
LSHSTSPFFVRVFFELGSVNMYWRAVAENQNIVHHPHQQLVQHPIFDFFTFAFSPPSLSHWKLGSPPKETTYTLLGITYMYVYTHTHTHRVLVRTDK